MHERVEDYGEMANPLVSEKLLVQLDAGLYFFINQGCLTVDSIDDPTEMVTVEVESDQATLNLNKLPRLTK